MELKDSVSKIKGVGAKKKELLGKLNIETVEDLLYLFPRKYEDRQRVIPIIEAPLDKDVLIQGTVSAVKNSASRFNKKAPLRVILEDNTGTCELVFFNARFLNSYFKVGDEYTLFGKISLSKSGRRQMAHPEFHKVGSEDDVRGILPVYPLTEGLTQKQMRDFQMKAKDAAEGIEEWLDPHIVREHKLCSPSYAVSNIHFPTERQSVLESRYRLVFEELLVLQTGLFYIKRGSHIDKEGIRIPYELGIDEFLNNLPFKLTSGQEKVWKEIETDLAMSKPMNRLVQGDVGSGKTCIAEMAMFKTVKGGFQAAMMAPTELLAKQHFASLNRDLGSLGLNVKLLCSSTKVKERREILHDWKRDA